MKTQTIFIGNHPDTERPWFRNMWNVIFYVRISTKLQSMTEKWQKNPRFTLLLYI